MELALFALVLAGIGLAVGRECCRSALARRCVAAGCCIIVCGGFLLAAQALSAADPKQKDPGKKGADQPAPKPAVKELVKPKGWPEGHPLPLIGSNCAACHLTAGRELTAAVVNFVRSAHDVQQMTCYDCHGGNTVDDVKAHEEEFGFIGTKKSAHIQHCSECHTEAAEALAAGPHHWDFSKRINTEFPLCFDCHGNHDIGNTPADFKLEAMCSDCHEKLDEEFPNLATVVRQNDKLWEALGKVRRANLAAENPLPEMFRDDVSSLRNQTMQIIHTSKEVSPEQAKELNDRAQALRTRLEQWLKSNPKPSAAP